MAGALAVTGGITGVTALNGGQIGGRRNIIINGDMKVAQRATSATGKTAAGYYAVDRNYSTIEDSGTWTITQTADGPSGFANCLRYDCTAADAAVAAGARMMNSYRLEGQDLQQIKKGTASAEQVTVSFWVKSNLTGNGVLELFDHDNTRQVSKLYAISSADTWEYKTITYPADTTGAFGDDNGKSLELQFYLCAGSTYTSGTASGSWAANTNANRAAGQGFQLSSSTANDWSITGLQMEIGATATEFEYSTFGEELALCQRYYEKSYDIGTKPGTASTLNQSVGLGIYTNNPAGYNRFGAIFYKVVKRAIPTVVLYAPATGNSSTTANATRGDGGTDFGYVVASQLNMNGFNISASVGGSSVTSYNTGFFAFTASSEL